MMGRVLAVWTRATNAAALGASTEQPLAPTVCMTAADAAYQHTQPQPSGRLAGAGLPQADARQPPAPSTPLG